MTSGTGIDIVSVARIARLIGDRGPRFLERWFTPGEIAYCNGKARPSLHFAARLAAKEAVVKALRSRWDGPLPWLSIEISNDERGAPGVQLRGSVLESATRDGVGTIQVSLSHCDEYATAIAIAELAG
jgi:holo-[acyl-carrier protein] synthase